MMSGFTIGNSDKLQSVNTFHTHYSLHSSQPICARLTHLLLILKTFQSGKSLFSSKNPANKTDYFLIKVIICCVSGSAFSYGIALRF